jgi:hypothetical protein
MLAAHQCILNTCNMEDLQELESPNMPTRESLHTMNNTLLRQGMPSKLDMVQRDLHKVLPGLLARLDNQHSRVLLMEGHHRGWTLRRLLLVHEARKILLTLFVTQLIILWQPTRSTIALNHGVQAQLF